MKIGISVGDPAGIGPEIIHKFFKTWGDHAVYNNIEWVVFGTPDFEYPNLTRHDIASDMAWKKITPGVACKTSATIQKRAFNAAITNLKAGQIDAIVTAPWTKSSFKLIGEPPVGHTEVLEAAICKDNPECKATMLLAGDALRVALVTTHIPLSEVAKNITKRAIFEKSRTVVDSLKRDFGIANPKVAVLGLNPHAGEDGAMGSEDRDIIGPAIKALNEEGLNIEGPFSADTYFIRYLHEAGERHDAVICMYHDQGLIPLKTIHFGESANITIGLPVVRTSVDHGTAYDIAGKGIADPASLKYAIDRAICIVKNRSIYQVKRT